MARWKKLIVSGSDAELNSVSVDTSLSVGDNQTIDETAELTVLSGSFNSEGVDLYENTFAMAVALG
jgi:hypothetical protein